jgi:tetratricopeptide (TPR) repeat protein
MRAYVFTERALERHAGRFVWLSINTEEEVNAPFLETHPVQGYPTYLVLEPGAGRPMLRWLGSATVAQLERLFDDAERAVAGAGGGSDAVLARADRLLAEGDRAGAAAAYREAFETSTADWTGRERALESLLVTLSVLERHDECAALARANVPAGRSAHFAFVASAGLGCALETEGAGRSQVLPQFEALARSAVGEPWIDIPADDRSSIYGMLVDARRAADDPEGATRVALEWLGYLEREAARAPAPEARIVFDSHRVAAAIAAGDAERAVPALLQSELEFPRDPNAPARLAILYKEAGRLDQALAAVDRALALVDGPRRLRVYTTKADILVARGDEKGARRVLKQALRHARKLPAGQRSTSAIENLEQRLARLGTKPEPTG